MANLKITIDRGPAETGAETGRIHVGIFPTPDCSPQSLTALMPDSLVKAPTKQFSARGSAFRGYGLIRRAGWRNYINRMFVEGLCPSTHIRSRFPLHPSLSALDGVSIEAGR